MTSPFYRARVNSKVAIEPCRLENALAAVKERLNAALFKYNDEIGGVPVLYEDLRFLPGKSCARIFGELPWLHVEVQAEFVIFRPVVGQKTFGRVSKASATHVSVLIYGMFNVTISADNLGQNFVYDISNTRW